MIDNGFGAVKVQVRFVNTGEGSLIQILSGGGRPDGNGFFPELFERRLNRIDDGTRNRMFLYQRRHCGRGGIEIIANGFQYLFDLPGEVRSFQKRAVGISGNNEASRDGKPPVHKFAEIDGLTAGRADISLREVFQRSDFFINMHAPRLIQYT